MTAVSQPATGGPVQTVSVVIPVYRGEQTLPALVQELSAYFVPTRTPAGHQFVITEIIPVWDCGPDRSDATIRRLEHEVPEVHPVWLARNYGQHPATMAGMTASTGDWVVTMDEDGQHDPADIGGMLDMAVLRDCTLVYGSPDNKPPHGFLRNLTSKGSKFFLQKIAGARSAPLYQSYRLIMGDTARAVASYAGPSVYLDVALGWVNRRMTTAPVHLRLEGRESGYRYRSLFAHFWRMVITVGTRPLRLVTLTGVAVAAIGMLFTLVILIKVLVSPFPVQGWASMMCVSMLGIGATLFAIGIVAEYIGVMVNGSMGRPLYRVGPDPATTPIRQLIAASKTPQPSAPTPVDATPSGPDAPLDSPATVDQTLTDGE